VLNKKHLDEPAPELVVRRFEELDRTCLVHMSGGEPFLFPGFVEMCAGLTRRNWISINTNLASPDLVALSPNDSARPAEGPGGRAPTCATSHRVDVPI